MTTDKQRSTLFSLWNRVAKAAGYDGAEKDLQRTEFTIAALELGPNDAIPSWGKLTTRQIDVLFSRLNRALKGGLPVTESGGVLEPDEDAAQRRRLVYSIWRDAQAWKGSPDAAEAALLEICRDIFGESSKFARRGQWRELPVNDGPPSSLQKLAFTVSRR